MEGRTLAIGSPDYPRTEFGELFRTLSEQTNLTSEQIERAAEALAQAHPLEKVRPGPGGKAARKERRAAERAAAKAARRTL